MYNSPWFAGRVAIDPPLLTGDMPMTSVTEGFCQPILDLHYRLIIVIHGNLKDPFRTYVLTFPTTIAPISVNGNPVLSGTVTIAVMNFHP